jgi:hypothetical protein
LTESAVFCEPGRRSHSKRAWWLLASARVATDVQATQLSRAPRGASLKTRRNIIMKSLKLIGLSLLAIFALGAFAASAFAEEGFLEGGTITPKTANILGGLSVLSVLKSETTIHCGKLDASTITSVNDKTGKATLRWLECKTGGLFGFNSLGDKAEEVLVPVEFTICLSPNNSGTDKFGVAVKIEGDVHLEVPALGTLIEVLGTVLGAVLTTGKAKLFNVELKTNGTLGDQAVTKCGTFTHTLASATNHEPEIDTALEISGHLIQFPKETELMS